MRVAFMPDPERAAEISASEKVVAGLVSVIIPRMLSARVLFSIGRRGNTSFTKGRRLIDVQYALKFRIMEDDGQMKEQGEMEMEYAPVEQQQRIVTLKYGGSLRAHFCEGGPEN